ncbi:hypothetical protein BN1182_AB_00360 [Pantoea ananatis]|nr:hypothetical protein BN1182_AB_00360 [Pantoea ananatis]
MGKSGLRAPLRLPGEPFQADWTVSGSASHRQRRSVGAGLAGEGCG